MQDETLSRVHIIKVPLDHLSFEHTDEDGTTWLWDVTEGNRIAATGHERMIISLREHGMTVATIRERYQGIDEDYAMTTDLTKPLLFIPFFQYSLLIDGWHRVFHAACKGIDDLSMYLLTQEEADSILWLTIPSKQATQ